jgi:hypothetical protein
MTKAVADGPRVHASGTDAVRLLPLVILFGLMVTAGVGLVRTTTAPPGVIWKASCTWHGDQLVMAGVIVNRTMSTVREFVVTRAFSLGGRAVPNHGTLAVYNAGPVSARA